MTDLFDNPTPPTARITDPATSFAAANSINPEKMRRCYEWLIQILGDHGPGTDEQLMSFMPAGIQSPSGLRTRRKELADAGYIIAAGYKRRLTSGLFGNVWSLTKMGEEYYTKMTGGIPLKGGNDDEIKEI